MSAPQTPFYPVTHDDAQELIAAIGEQSKFADPYDSTATYSQGDHCIHAGKYYAAKQDISTAEEWTAAHWEEVQVGEEITAQAKSIGKILPVITGTTNNSGYTISSGEYFEANGKLYKATASIPTGNAWSSSATEQTDHGAINALNSKITNIISGITDGFSIEANTNYASNSISFGKTFTSIPSVVASPLLTAGPNEISHVVITDVTTTDFKFRVRNTYSSQLSNVKVNWIAIGN